MRASRCLAASSAAAVVAMAGVLGGGCTTFTTADPAPSEDGGPPETSLADGAVADGPRVDEAGDGAPSTPVLLASGYGGQLSGVVADEQTVYFIDRGKGGLHAVPLAGGTAKPRVMLTAPSSLALGGDGTLYWAELGQSKIGRLAPTGPPTMHDVEAPVAVAFGVSPGAPPDRFLVAAKGNTPTVRHFDAANLTSLGGTAAAVANPYDLAVAGSAVYWTDASQGAIFQGSIDDSGSGDPTVIDESDCRSLAVDSLGLYWTRPGASLVRTRAAVAGAVAITLAGSQQSPHSVAADASGVYWMTTDGALRRSRRDETPITTIAAGLKGDFGPNSYTQAIALTNAYVVWITADGSVYRHAK